MNATTSDWFAGLANDEKKALVCMLFDIRNSSSITNNPRHMLFKELLARLDAEYHAIKGA